MSTSFSVIERTREALKDFGLSAESSIDLDQYAAKSDTTTSVNATATGLLNWCRDAERMVVNRPLQGCAVYAGFERLSRARFVEKRYQKIAEASGELHVFGQPDAKLSFPVTHLHQITTGPLILEWFLLVKDPAFTGLLSARDLDGFDSRVSPRERRFEGVITHDVRVIDRLIAEIEEHFPNG